MDTNSKNIIWIDIGYKETHPTFLQLSETVENQLLDSRQSTQEKDSTPTVHDESSNQERH